MLKNVVKITERLWKPEMRAMTGTKKRPLQLLFKFPNLSSYVI